MPHCENCGSHVTPDYARVCTDGHVRDCPHCNGNYMDLSAGSCVDGTLHSLR